MIRPRPLQTLIGIGAGLALAGGGYALASPGGKEIRACANDRTHVLTLRTRCPRGTRSVVWSARGPAGPRGRSGATGPAGKSGASATLNPSVNVTQVGPTTPASASITQGSGGHDTLNLSIPQGAKGDAGPAGASTGPNAYGEVWVGSSTAQLAPGSGVGVETVTGGTGSAFVKVTNCAAPTPTEPIIVVTPNKDSTDNLSGSNSNTTGEPTAYVDGYSDGNSPGAHVATFTVTLTSTTGTAIATDFSFTVTC